jgi:glycerol-3-phosphate acyltransferase PlsX
VVAVDCNGADLGPGEVAAGAALAARQGTRVLLFGPAAELGELPEGVEVDDSPVSIAKAPDPVKALPHDAAGVDRQGGEGGRRRPRRRAVCAGGTGAALAAGIFNISARPASTASRWRCRLPIPNSP